MNISAKSIMEKKEQEKIRYGESLFVAGNIKEALATFESVLDKDPDNFFALNDKGVVLNKLERYSEAIEVFRDVIKKDKNNSTAAFNLISNYLTLGKLRNAEKAMLDYGNCLMTRDIEILEKEIGRIKDKIHCLNPAIKNILFPTVRQSNCGDEFILMGVLNIIDSLQPEYNRVIWNRNMEVCRRLALRDKVIEVKVNNIKEKIPLNLEELFFENVAFRDDSFTEEYSLDSIGAVIFAGSPEWAGYKLQPLYEKLSDYDGPILFLGLGYHEGLVERCLPYTQWDDIWKDIHKKASVFTVRDSLLIDYLKPEIEATLLPCPALLCSKGHRERNSIKKIGVSLQAKQGATKVSFVPEEVYIYSIKLLEELSKHYDVEVVCHFIEDLIYLTKVLGNTHMIRYSYDAKDYLEIYDNYDLVISTRVHGSGMAASLGIPTFTIAHSMRTDTVKGFLSHVISPKDDIEDVLIHIETMDLLKESRKIISHKNATLEDYKKILSPHFPL